MAEAPSSTSKAPPPGKQASPPAGAEPTPKLVPDLSLPRPPAQKGPFDAQGALPTREAELPPADWGNLGLQLGVAAPTHLAATALLLGGLCSGHVVDASCKKGFEAEGGDRIASFVLLGTLPPLASAGMVHVLADDPPGVGRSFLLTAAAGTAAQLLGMGLAEATGRQDVALLSLTLLPALAEVVTSHHFRRWED